MPKEFPITHDERRSNAACAIRHSSFVIRILLAAIRAYKIFISPVLTFLCGPVGGCRFTPTCSAYALDALREHGAATGSLLAAKRICRCQPWGGCGHDPVPKKGFRFQVSGFKF